MRRRTPRRTKAALKASAHHSVYVVLLDSAVRKSKRVRNLNPNWDPAKPCVYVGMTGLTIEERFENHKSGTKASYYVKKFGQGFLPELFTHLNPMPFEQACLMERELADDLRREGYTVTGGHGQDVRMV